MYKIPVKFLVNEFLKNREFLEGTQLCALMIAFGSDKGGPRHNYTTLYTKLFKNWRHEKIHLFELGIGTTNLNIPSNMGVDGVPGASLFAWKSYFPLGQIYGADIDKDILFTEERIKTFYCDQIDKKSIEAMFKEKDFQDVFFDIMLDDGYHDFEHNFTLLANSIQRLKKGGVYIIEDLQPCTAILFEPILKDLKKQLSLSYIKIVKIPHDYPDSTDNVLLIIQK